MWRQGLFKRGATSVIIIMVITIGCAAAVTAAASVGTAERSMEKSARKPRAHHHRCASICFDANWEDRHRRHEDDDDGGGSTGSKTVQLNGSLHDYFYPAHLEDGDRQQHEFGVKVKRNSSVMCRRRNIHHLPCNRSWPMRVCCRLQVFRLRGKASTGQSTIFVKDKSKRSQSQHNPQTHALRWRCKTEIGLHKIPNSVFGEDASVSCFRNGTGADRQNGNKVAALLSLPDLSHVRVRRSDAESTSWKEFSKQMVDAEEAQERVVGDVQHHMLVVLDEMQESDEGDDAGVSGGAGGETEGGGEDGEQDIIHDADDGEACYRWIPRGEQCHVTISLRNHDKKKLQISIFILVGTLFLVLFVVLCRPGARQQRKQAMAQALDDLEQASLERAVEREHRLMQQQKKTATSAAAVTPAGGVVKVPANSNAFQIDEIVGPLYKFLKSD